MRLAKPESPQPIATRSRQAGGSSTSAPAVPLRTLSPVFAKYKNGARPEGYWPGSGTRSRPATQTRSRMTRALASGRGGGSTSIDESHVTLAMGDVEPAAAPPVDAESRAAAPAAESSVSPTRPLASPRGIALTVRHEPVRRSAARPTRGTLDHQPGVPQSGPGTASGIWT
jgi:hypothetical protein